MTIIPASALDTLTGLRDRLSSLEPAATEAEAIDRIQAFSRLKSACDAALAGDIARLDHLRSTHETRQGVPKAKRCKGLSAEVALACSESPARGKQRLDLARMLMQDLPHTCTALWEGQIREEHAQAVAKEISWLSSKNRREVDRLLANQLGSVGPRQLGNEARAHAQRLDHRGAAQRLQKAETERRVTLRAAPDGLSQLTAIGPTAQLASLYNTLRRDANSKVKAGNITNAAEQPRTRDQLMFDDLVERGTGQTTATAPPAEVVLLMTPDTLFARGDTPAWLTGHGPIPAAAAREWLANEDAAVMLRRLFTEPEGHQIVSFESRSRVFRSGLRKLILLRDNTCRTPYCEAPIQDIDHITPHREGGSTSWDNSSGLCAGCNQTKENRGWKHRGDAQFMRISTPTGHVYTKTTPPVMPGRDPHAVPQRRRTSGQHSKEPADPPHSA